MYRYIVDSAKLAVLAAAVLLSIPGTSEAQRGGRGGGGGGRGYGGGGFYGGRGYGGGYYGGRGFYGDGWGYGLGLGLGLGWPYYGGGYYYGDPGYSAAPIYYDSTASIPATSTYNSFYPPDTTVAQSANMSARVEVQVPPDAQLTFEGQKTTQTGSFRTFDSPPLQPGSSYSYNITATWNNNGTPVTQSRTVPVAPGRKSFVSFLQPPAGQQGQPQQLPSPKIGDQIKQQDQ